MDFNLDDIEEVESTPKRRIRDGNNNYHRHNHIHHHHNHIHNHNENQNRNNINNQKKLRRRVFIKNFEFPEKLLMCIFLSSTFVLFFSFFINIILTLKEIITPRLFLPSIIMFIITFFFSGGILGTYVSPPPGVRFKMKIGEMLLMRYLTPIIMSIMSIIFLVHGENRLKFLKLGIQRAHKICQENYGLSMEEINSKLNKTNYELEQLKYNLIYTFNNNLVCFPKGICIKLINEENTNTYICNTDEFIKYSNIEDAKCKKINFNDKDNYSKDKNQKVYLFLENCKEINNNNFTAIEMFICQSNNNLEKIKLIPNWNENDKAKIENYFNNKLDKYNIQLDKNQQIMEIYNFSEYSYDLECYNQFDYKLAYFMINSYRIIFYFVGLSWIFLGIYGIYQFFKILKNGRINNISHDEMKDINGIPINEDNKLIVDQAVKNDDKYIELSQNPQ